MIDDGRVFVFLVRHKQTIQRMTNTQYNPASVEKFFVFCPRLGATEETEHEKILFYFPTEAPLHKQQTDVGLGEGIINFVK
jgi:hypothetical protein